MASRLWSALGGRSRPTTPVVRHWHAYPLRRRYLASLLDLPLPSIGSTSLAAARNEAATTSPEKQAVDDPKLPPSQPHPRRTSTAYLQYEDRPDFEHILGELLNHEEIRLALRRSPGGPTSEQLRSRALRDSLTISANASAEYAYYREIREQVRDTVHSGAQERLGGSDPAQWQAPEGPLDAAERAGWVPLLAVLLPILSGLGAIVMLLLGYLLRAEHVSLGQPLVTAGFLSAVFCATAIAVDIIGLLLTAARDAATPPNGRNPEPYAELARARDAWRVALRDHALLPYLLAQLGASKQQIGVDYGATAQPVGVSLVRTRPRLGASRPEPGRTTDGEGHELEAESDPEPRFSSPGFTEPNFTAPDFTSPADFAGDLSAMPPPFPYDRPRSRFLPRADDLDPEDAEIREQDST